jgi:predicted transport protein
VEELFLGPKRSYEDFKKQITSEMLPTFDSLRQFCFSLGKNVVEDIRAHRIVFGKSLSFRWFADLEPEKQSITVKVQHDRKEPFKTISINHEQNLDQIKKLILDAYTNIR